MSYDPAPECYVCLSKRVTKQWSLCRRCEASYSRHKRYGGLTDMQWAASRARFFADAKRAV